MAWGSLALYPSDMNPKFVQSWPEDQWNGSISPSTTFHLAAYRHQLHSIWQQFAISFISSGSISPLAMLSKSTSTIFHLASLSSAWSCVHPILTIDQLVKWQHIAINYISSGSRSPSVSSLCNVMLGNNIALNIPSKSSLIWIKPHLPSAASSTSTSIDVSSPLFRGGGHRRSALLKFNYVR